MIVEGTKAEIFERATSDKIDVLELRGEPLALAISNNRKQVVAAIRNILFTDIYHYKKTAQGSWDMTMVTRLQKPPRGLSWEEAEDPGYPPIELVITHGDGGVERVWVG